MCRRKLSKKVILVYVRSGWLAFIWTGFRVLSESDGRGTQQRILNKSNALRGRNFRLFLNP
jgi:hypothetical protein